jgi:hypothetical protein
MIPSVFVSSTVADLAYLRDVIKASLEELALTPVMSEYGGVGFLVDNTAIESCYNTVRQCHIAVLIVGKRYGTVGADGRSVTHMEHLAARDAAIPVLCLVDREILSFKKVFDSAPSESKPPIPEMDNPAGTFALIDSVMNAPSNNAILPFHGAEEARRALRTQVAHMFGDLLTRRFPPLAGEVREVLAEVKNLRSAMISQEAAASAAKSLRAVRALLEDKFHFFRMLVEDVAKADIADVASDLIAAPTFDAFVKKRTGMSVEINDAMMKKPTGAVAKFVNARSVHYAMAGPELPGLASKRYAIAIREDQSVVASSDAVEAMDYFLRHLHSLVANPRPYGGIGPHG